MVLADTSVWIAHLRVRDATFSDLLRAGSVLMHPFVMGELIMGNLADRRASIAFLSDLKPATAAADAEVMTFVERWRLFERGIGFVDAHLLASTRVTPGAALWTRDHRLHAAAAELGVSASLK